MTTQAGNDAGPPVGSLGCRACVAVPCLPLSGVALVGAAADCDRHGRLGLAQMYGAAVAAVIVIVRDAVWR